MNYVMIINNINQKKTEYIKKIINNKLKKNVKKLKKLKRENEDADDADIYRVKGEILTAFMHKVEQGMNLIELENFYADNQPIEIALDPQKSPARNAQWYFNRYQKLKSR